MSALARGSAGISRRVARVLYRALLRRGLEFDRHPILKAFSDQPDKPGVWYLPRTSFAQEIRSTFRPPASTKPRPLEDGFGALRQWNEVVTKVASQVPWYSKLTYGASDQTSVLQQESVTVTDKIQAGSILVAHPRSSINDFFASVLSRILPLCTSCAERAVILILKHDTSETIGVIVNQRMSEQTLITPPSDEVEADQTKVAEMASSSAATAAAVAPPTSTSTSSDVATSATPTPSTPPLVLMGHDMDPQFRSTHPASSEEAVPELGEGDLTFDHPEDPNIKIHLGRLELVDDDEERLGELWNEGEEETEFEFFEEEEEDEEASTSLFTTTPSTAATTSTSSKTSTMKQLYRGGPVAGFTVLHSSPEFGQPVVSFPGLYFSNEPEEIRKLLLKASPDSYCICSGFSRWAPYQLQSELNRGVWIMANVTPSSLFPYDPATKTYLFDDTDSDSGKQAAIVADRDPMGSEPQWQRILNLLGGEFSHFAHVYRAPSHLPESTQSFVSEPPMAAATQRAESEN